MKIIVCGAGEVGSNIAKQLVSEANDVTIIDESEELLRSINQTLDVKSSAVTDDFVKLMDQKAGGIPMYLSSMTNWLKERDLVKKNDDGT